MSEKVYYDEFLRALEEAGGITNTEGLTTGELMEALGLGRLQVQKLLHSLMKEGRLAVGRKFQTAIDGRRQRIPCYKIKQEAKGA